jgi:hypothetical protein
VRKRNRGFAALYRGGFGEGNEEGGGDRGGGGVILNICMRREGKNNLQK